jgi:Holliday junction resolvase-like predicted endonuclease
MEELKEVQDRERMERERERAERERERADRERERMERQREWEERQKRYDEKVAWIDQLAGKFSLNLGQLVEYVFLPGIISKFNSLGYDFTAASSRKEYYRADKQKFTEIDLLLENRESVMVVEVKTNVALKDIGHHVKRMELLRENESITHFESKKLYAALAGLYIDNDAREAALDNGIYIVELFEDEERLEVTSPPEDKIGVW